MNGLSIRQGVRTWRLGPTYLIEGGRGHDGVDCFEEGLHGLEGVYHVCTEDDLGGADKMLGDGLGPVEEGDGGVGGGGGGREGREGGGRLLRERATLLRMRSMQIGLWSVSVTLEAPSRAARRPAVRGSLVRCLFWACATLFAGFRFNNPIPFRVDLWPR